jgi:hypothetical protein
VGLAKAAPDDEDAHGVLLLEALHRLFGDADKLRSEAIVEALNDSEELPFGGYRKGVGIDSRGLARLLKPFGICPRTLRFGQITAKGYERRQFSEAWKRYCDGLRKPVRDVDPPLGRSASVTSVTSAPQSQISATFYPSQTGNVTDARLAEKPHGNADVTDVTDRNPPGEGEHANESLVEATLARYGVER